MLRSSLLIVFGLLAAALGTSVWPQHDRRSVPRDLPWGARLYPARGLVMRRGADDVAVLPYAAPADFGRLHGLIAGQSE